jgi:peptide/nickel transport system substrate-binding protein
MRLTSRSSRTMMALGCGIAALALVASASACGSSTPGGKAGARVSGGTAVMAEPPATVPNYIFPFASSSYQTVANLGYVQHLLYRPLYWFGQGAQPVVNNSLSLAYPPTWSGNTVTVKLKPYRWSDGTPVTADNVMFWLNMLKADGATDYGAYTGFPSAFVTSYKSVGPAEFQMTTNKTYSHRWFFYNDLSQITPMPTAWDRTASGPSHCETTPGDCTAVYGYLNAQAKNLSGYVSSPLWSVVDGPWRLSAFNFDGHVTLVPNKSYSGPVKPSLSAFQLVPFTTEDAEYNVLRAVGAGTQKIDVGYIPTADVPVKPVGAPTGPNPVPGYTLSPWYSWGINYFVVNLQSTTGNGPVNKQLYFRQAVAQLLNQQAVISGPLRGYGIPTTGPVGNTPVTSYLSAAGKAGPPYTYNPAAARSLLSSHGWHVVPNGTTICADPSLCGAGVRKDQPLIYTMVYVSGVSWIDSEMAQLQSAAALVGMKITLEQRPSNDVISLGGGDCLTVKTPCNWDMVNWGPPGWAFGPDYMPTGETLFMCAAPVNSGGYCSAQNDADITKTLSSDNLSYMYTWQDYLSKQLPFVWQPNAPYQLTEVADNLKGVTPQETTLNITPEAWYFTK